MSDISWETCTDVVRESESLSRGGAVELLSECHKWNLETIGGDFETFIIGIVFGFLIAFWILLGKGDQSSD